MGLDSTGRSAAKEDAEIVTVLSLSKGWRDLCRCFFEDVAMIANNQA